MDRRSTPAPAATSRPPYAEWTDLDLDQATDMIADRVIAAREAGWQRHDDDGTKLNRTMGFAHLGGATLGGQGRGAVATWLRGHPVHERVEPLLHN
jgi:hypothetical protein